MSNPSDAAPIREGERPIDRLLRLKREQQERDAKAIAEGRMPQLMRGAKPVLVGNRNGW